MRELVRRVVYRAVGRPPRPAQPRARTLFTRSDLETVSTGSELLLPEGALVTPLARQTAMERRISLVAPGGGAARPAGEEATERPGNAGSVAIGADHGGFELKELLKEHLGRLGYAVTDCGTHGTASVDYPDFALDVARRVAEGRAARGIVVDGAGIGSCMAANKVPGVRAALCYDEATAVNSRAHNHANVLTLGAGLIGPALARRIVTTWLTTPAGGGRHARRVQKIVDIERRFLAAAAAR